MHSEYGLQLKNCKDEIANAKKEKLAAVEKCQKQEEALKYLKRKYDKLYNHYVRDSSKFIEEMNNNTSEQQSTRTKMRAIDNENEIITIF